MVGLIIDNVWGDSLFSDKPYPIFTWFGFNTWHYIQVQYIQYLYMSFWKVQSLLQPNRLFCLLYPIDTTHIKTETTKTIEMDCSKRYPIDTLQEFQRAACNICSISHRRDQAVCRGQAWPGSVPLGWRKDGWPTYLGSINHHPIPDDPCMEYLPTIGSFLGFLCR